MATASEIRGVFELLNMPPPSDRRVRELIDGGKTLTQIRDGLLSFLANSDPDDDLDTAQDVLIDIIDTRFEEAGIEDAGAGDESEEERLARIARQIASGDRTLGEVTETIAEFDTGGGPGTTEVGGTVIPNDVRLVRVRNPEGSDEPFLYYLVHTWRGVDTAYEIGGPERFRELFGSADNFDALETVSQNQFDDTFITVGSADQIIGATESLTAVIERDIRALGLEDLPQWLDQSPEALAIVASATAQEWSSGRLWKELSTTSAFQDRYGGAIDLYLDEGATVAEAVAQLEADEDSMLAALRPFGDAPPSLEFVHGLLNEGWTPGAAAQVLEVSQALVTDPDSLEIANFILEASGLETLDEVGFINALQGVGPQETIEALNTATAANALEEAGIDLPDDDLNLIMDLVDTSDRLLTADSWRGLAQELSLNLVRFANELDEEKLGIVRDDVIAAAFGQESPTGRSSGEVLSLVARLERDRRAAGQGFDVSQGFLDQEGRLRIQGLSGL